MQLREKGAALHASKIQIQHELHDGRVFIFRISSTDTFVGGMLRTGLALLPMWGDLWLVLVGAYGAWSCSQHGLEREAPFWPQVDACELSVDGYRGMALLGCCSEPFLPPQAARAAAACDPRCALAPFRHRALLPPHDCPALHASAPTRLPRCPLADLTPTSTNNFGQFRTAAPTHNETAHALMQATLWLSSQAHFLAQIDSKKNSSTVPTCLFSFPIRRCSTRRARPRRAAGAAAP